MRQPPIEEPGKQVALVDGVGELVARRIAHPDRRAGAHPEDLEVQHAPVIDIAVGVLHRPSLRIRREVAQHILMNEALQVEPKGIAPGSHHDTAQTPVFRGTSPPG
jgi:hypothetical protein